ncbi:hypothetical protein LLG95_03910 [bacterium]|nr:hypothetical protein [bacterium]
MRRCSFLLMAVMCLIPSGCTQWLWQDPLIKELNGCSVSGRATVNSGNLKGSKYLIVSYENHKSGLYIVENEFAIPLVNGEVPEPFKYEGVKKTPQEMIAGLPPETVAHIKNYRFSPESYRLACSLRRNNGVEDTLELAQRRMGGSNIVVNGIRICPYSFVGDDVPGAAVEDQAKAKKNPYDPPFDERVRMILLPATQERVKSERNWRIFTAACWTPLTVAVDAVVYPILFVSYAIDKL